MTLWEDPWSLFIFIYSPPFLLPSFPVSAFVLLFCNISPTPCQFGRFFLKEKATRRLKKWTKPASWESLSRGWRPWAKGTMRGERITSAATLWWVKINRRLHLASCILYLSHMYPLPFITSTFSSILTLHIIPSLPPPSPGSLCIPQEVRQGWPHCPLPFSSHFQALHGGLALSPMPQKYSRFRFLLKKI